MQNFNKCMVTRGNSTVLMRNFSINIKSITKIFTREERFHQNLSEYNFKIKYYCCKQHKSEVGKIHFQLFKKFRKTGLFFEPKYLG